MLRLLSAFWGQGEGQGAGAVASLFAKSAIRISRRDRKFHSRYCSEQMKGMRKGSVVLKERKGCWGEVGKSAI